MAHTLSEYAAPRIDAHMHWWSTRRSDYGWLTPELPTLYRDFGPAEATPLLEAARIGGVILVQAAPTLAETLYLLDLARSNSYVLGVVGWADLADPAEVDTLAAAELTVGVRPMLEDIADTNWILRPELREGLQRIAAQDLAFEALITPRHLPIIAALVDRHPTLRVIVDHAAKPSITVGRSQPWKSQLAALAAESRIYCKLSGLVTEAPRGAGFEALRPYVEAVFELFGAERVIWGSDWPVLTQRMDYASWVQLAEQLTAHLSPQSRAGVFGGNAQRFYGKRLRAAPG